MTTGSDYAHPPGGRPDIESPTGNIILVHGSPGDGRSWSRVVKRLPASVSVQTPGLPGYGDAPGLTADGLHRTAGMAAAIADLIADGSAPVFLVGHSFGGNVALHAALSCPDRIQGLLLCEPVFMRALALNGDDDILTDTRAFFDDYVHRVEAGKLDSVSMMIDFWFGGGAFAKLPEPVQGFLKTAAPMNAKDVSATFSETVSRNALAAFDRPVLIAHGDDSPPVAGAIARALAGLLPRAEVTAISGASHGMLDSHAEAIAALIVNHLSASLTEMP